MVLSLDLLDVLPIPRNLIHISSESKVTFSFCSLILNVWLNLSFKINARQVAWRSLHSVCLHVIVMVISSFRSFSLHYINKNLINCRVQILGKEPNNGISWFHQPTIVCDAVSKIFLYNEIFLIIFYRKVSRHINQK